MNNGGKTKSVRTTERWKAKNKQEKGFSSDLPQCSSYLEFWGGLRSPKAQRHHAVYVPVDTCVYTWEEVYTGRAGSRAYISMCSEDTRMR